MSRLLIITNDERAVRQVQLAFGDACDVLPVDVSDEAMRVMREFAAIEWLPLNLDWIKDQAARHTPPTPKQE